MFSCCFWWFLLGAIVGWLLNWALRCFCSCCAKKCSASHTEHNSANTNHQQTNAGDNKPNNLVAEASLNPSNIAESFVLDTKAANLAGFKLKGPNDLTVIEGIGPKIRELFNNAGYVTFADVAKMSEAQMQKILDDAGARYRLAKPGTWSQQATLAAQNKWAELKKLQDNLTGGV